MANSLWQLLSSACDLREFIHKANHSSVLLLPVCANRELLSTMHIWWLETHETRKMNIKTSSFSLLWPSLCGENKHIKNVKLNDSAVKAWGPYRAHPHTHTSHPSSPFSFSPPCALLPPWGSLIAKQVKHRCYANPLIWGTQSNHACLTHPVSAVLPRRWE